MPRGVLPTEEAAGLQVAGLLRDRYGCVLPGDTGEGSVSEPVCALGWHGQQSGLDASGIAHPRHYWDLHSWDYFGNTPCVTGVIVHSAVRSACS